MHHFAVQLVIQTIHNLHILWVHNHLLLHLLSMRHLYWLRYNQWYWFHLDTIMLVVDKYLHLNKILFHWRYHHCMHIPIYQFHWLVKCFHIFVYHLCDITWLHQWLHRMVETVYMTKAGFWGAMVISSQRTSEILLHAKFLNGWWYNCVTIIWCCGYSRNLSIYEIQDQ